MSIAHSSDLKSQTVLIVGGTSGIGFGVAKELLLSHALGTIIVASSDKAKVDQTLQQLSAVNSSSQTKVKGEVCNARDSQSIRDLMSRVGEIDHLVWTSAKLIAPDYPKTDLDSEPVRHALDLHFWGPLVACQAAKFKDGGSITITSGMSLDVEDSSGSLPTFLQVQPSRTLQKGCQL
jgi:NAD(P)-dependent dehydrogenase (short-subunit alcohol dehydrogenase family)